MGRTFWKLTGYLLFPLAFALLLVRVGLRLARFWLNSLKA